MTKFEGFILNLPPIKFLSRKTKKIILPGFERVPLYDVIAFFLSQMRKVGLSERAAAISFNFLMAIPAATIFLCTLIPFFPISSDITEELLNLTKIWAPNNNTYELVKDFLTDFLNTPRFKLLSVGFILAVFYASSAVMGIMRSFNRSLSIITKQNFLHERLMAIRITTVLILLIIVTTTLLVTQGTLFSMLMLRLDIHNVVVKWLIHSVRWIIVVALILYSIGFIYKYAPAISKRWRLASPGAIFATTLIVLFTVGFSYWVRNFASYNKIYGSIGTILILMVLIYTSSLILLIGYELNVSIHSLKAMADERKKHEIKGEAAL
jgi:membrane protein